MILRLSDCLKWLGTPRFAEEFLDELQNHLPSMDGLLQDLCGKGAPSENTLPKISNLVMDDRTPREHAGHFELSFDRSVNLGYRDLEYTEPVRGTVRFLIDLETGDLALEAERVPQRAYGMESSDS